MSVMEATSSAPPVDDRSVVRFQLLDRVLPSCEAEIERCFHVRMRAIHAASILRAAEALLRVGGDIVDAERARMIASGLRTRQIDFVKVEEDAA